MYLRVPLSRVRLKSPFRPNGTSIFCIEIGRGGSKTVGGQALISVKIVADQGYQRHTSTPSECLLSVLEANLDEEYKLEFQNQ